MFRRKIDNEEDDVTSTRTPLASPAASAQHDWADDSPTPRDSPSARQRAGEVLRHPVSRVTGDLRRPSVRIRRLPSSGSGREAVDSSSNNAGLQDIPEEAVSGRRRSSSEPQRPSWYSRPGAAERLARIGSVDQMPSLQEDSARPQKAGIQVPRSLAEDMRPHLENHVRNGDPESVAELQAHVDSHAAHLGRNGNRSIMSRVGHAATHAATHAARRIPGVGGAAEGHDDKGSIHVTVDGENEYDSEMVDLLDVIDPEVATLSTLTNVQNSLFVPNLGRLINRRPTYNLSRGTTEASRYSRPASVAASERETQTEKDKAVSRQPTSDSRDGSLRPPLTHTSTISSTLSESRFAVLPHGENLAGWTAEEKAELNDLVRHMLHSRRAAFKRSMKGFVQYVKRPLGFFITLYAVLITLFGAAWVLFLIGWISLGAKKAYVINVVDNVLVALFAIMGDGLAPFRAVDTYHMIYIAHYHHLTWRLRRKMNLPKLNNRNDLPAIRKDDEADIEYAAVENSKERREFRGTWEYSVLTTEQQKKLQHHQAKFAISHTFYKPHETETHHAFPLRLLVAIVILLDCHSLWQISLGAVTWGINYKVRPFWLTTFILCCSICCNIAGGVLISIGDHRTRKKDVIEKMFRQELTYDAMHAVRKARLKQAEEAAEAAAEALEKATNNSSSADGETEPFPPAVLPILPKPVHVPPPVRKRKDMGQEMAEREAVAKLTGLQRRERKNRWRNIPRLPWLLHRENEQFEKQERERERREEMERLRAERDENAVKSAS